MCIWFKWRPLLASVTTNNEVGNKLHVESVSSLNDPPQHCLILMWARLSVVVVVDVFRLFTVALAATLRINSVKGLYAYWARKHLCLSEILLVPREDASRAVPPQHHQVCQSRCQGPLKCTGIHCMMLFRVLKTTYLQAFCAILALSMRS